MQLQSPSGLSIDISALLRLRHLCTARAHASHLRVGAMPGPITTRRQGRGSEIDDVRPWHFGDDLRHIDRNSTARTGMPHAKTFREEREQTIVLAADFRRPMLFGTRRALMSVAAAEILSLYGWLSVEGGARVGLFAFGDGEPVYVKPASGNRGMMAVIGGLARAHPRLDGRGQEGCAQLDACLNLAAGLLPHNATLVLASSLDAPGRFLDDALHGLLHRGRINVALIDDAFSRQAPKGRYPFVTMRGLSGVRIWAGKSSVESKNGNDASWLRGLGIGVATFLASTEPCDQLDPVRRFHDGRW